MSYISIEALPTSNFADPAVRKAVTTVWFRVPQTSIDKCKANYIPPGPSSGLINGVPGTIYQQVPDGAVGTNVGQTAATPPTLQPMNGVIPLVTFGQIISDSSYLTKTTGVNTPSGVTEELWLFTGDCVATLVSSSANPDHYDTTTTEDQTYTRDPCYIGIDCSQDPPVLRVNLQTASFPEMSHIFAGIKPSGTNSGLIKLATGVVIGPDGLCSQLVQLTITGGVDAGETTYGWAGTPFDSTTAYSDNAAFFQNAYPEVFGGSSPTITITPDQWHCLILAFDLSGAVSATGTVSGNETLATMSSSCKMWVALDDVNYTSFDLPTANWTIFGESGPPPAPIEGAGPNDIYTIRAIETYAGFTAPANSVTPYVDPNGQYGTVTVTGAGAAATYSFSPASLPVSDQPMGLPAAAEMVDDVYHVEMAEFQMFTGITIDTNNIVNRRYFIDDNGLPVPPAQKANSDTGKTSGSIEGLGRQPDILFHRALNWKQGRNTGTSGYDYSQVPAQKIDAGQFTPTAKIRSYTPGPSLNGPQGDPQ